MLDKIKKFAEILPYSIGSKLALVPYSIRLGKTYNQFKVLSQKEHQTMPFVIEQFSQIFEYAKNNFPFYQELYRKTGVLDLKIQSLEDIIKIPIITKEDIRNNIDQFKGSMLLNTGGTSGEPFRFYVDKYAFGREWAHMHTIWEKKGYQYTDLKITLRGRDLGEKTFQYNPVHNEFIINTYKNIAEVKDNIIQLFSKYEIKYIHGYPSAVYNFLQELDMVISLDEKNIITKNLISCFLGSEFPMPHITCFLESKWGLDYISWYGHSEMCILAYDETKQNDYKPFYTYGYTEVVNKKLIGTSYHNFDMPLIRYDTGDLVEPYYLENGLLDSFKITEGRNGDFILDVNHKRIPLYYNR